MSPTLAQAEDIPRIFQEMESSRIHNVAGLKEIHSGKAGPRVYVGMGTHGNERMGLALALPFLRDEIALEAGSVILAVNNLEGVRRNQRRLDHDRDFNRLPLDILDASTKNDGHYSSIRIRELVRAGVTDVSHGFDAHTFRVPGTAMKLHIKGDTHLADSIGVPDYLTHITSHQKDHHGQRTVAFGNILGGIDNEKVPVVEVEGGGPHNELRVIKGLVGGLLSTLAHLGMVDPSKVGLVERELEQNTHKIIGWQLAGVGYEVKRDFKQYDELRAGEVIAEDTQEPKRSPILAPNNSLIVFPPRQGVLERPSEWFLAEPAEKTVVRAFMLP